jgi:hypothetical protein
VARGTGARSRARTHSRTRRVATRPEARTAIHRGERPFAPFAASREPEAIVRPSCASRPFVLGHISRDTRNVAAIPPSRSRPIHAYATMNRPGRCSAGMSGPVTARRNAKLTRSTLGQARAPGYSVRLHEG